MKHALCAEQGTLCKWLINPDSWNPTKSAGLQGPALYVLDEALALIRIASLSRSRHESGGNLPH